MNYLNIILVVVSQIIFSFSRNMNLRYTSNDMVLSSILSSFVIRVSWLISTAIGITSIINNDFIMLFFYVCAGAVGELLSFKIKLK